MTSASSHLQLLLPVRAAAPSSTGPAAHPAERPGGLPDRRDREEGVGPGCDGDHPSHDSQRQQSNDGRLAMALPSQKCPRQRRLRSASSWSSSCAGFNLYDWLRKTAVPADSAPVAEWLCGTATTATAATRRPAERGVPAAAAARPGAQRSWDLASAAACCSTRSTARCPRSTPPRACRRPDACPPYRRRGTYFYRARVRVTRGARGGPALARVRSPAACTSTTSAAHGTPAAASRPAPYPASSRVADGVVVADTAGRDGAAPPPRYDWYHPVAAAAGDPERGRRYALSASGARRRWRPTTRRRSRRGRRAGGGGQPGAGPATARRGAAGGLMTAGGGTGGREAALSRRGRGHPHHRRCGARWSVSAASRRSTTCACPPARAGGARRGRRSTS